MFEKEIKELKNKERFDIEDLRTIIRILRSENGCPWDREQTHESIIPGFIEETYEVVEAIEEKNSEMLCEELGDVLLQIVFHCQLEEEKGTIDFEDAVSGVCRKMIVRHPHVFGDVTADTSEEVLRNWDKIKAETKHQKSFSERLESIAKPMPALMRTQKVIHKSKKEGVMLGETYLESDEGEAGKALFDAVVKCESYGLDAETVLRHYCDAVIKSLK